MEPINTFNVELLSCILIEHSKLRDKALDDKTSGLRVWS